MTPSKTSSTTSYSRAGSPSIDELLADLKASVAPPTSDHIIYRPRTANAPIGQANQFTAPVAHHSLPPVQFTTLGKDTVHPQGFDSSAFGQASRSPCIQWDANLVARSHRHSGDDDQRFVVNSGTAFGVEGYDDICCLKRKASDEDVEMSDVDMGKKQKAVKSPSRRSTRKPTSSPSPAKRAPSKTVSGNSAPRKSTPVPAPAPTPRPQTRQKSASVGPSANIPVRQTRWTTQAEKTILYYS